MTAAFISSMRSAMNDAWTELAEIIGHSYCPKTSSDELINSEIERAHEIANGIDEILKTKDLTDGFGYPGEIDEVVFTISCISQKQSRDEIRTFAGFALGTVDDALYVLEGGAGQ